MNFYILLSYEQLGLLVDYLEGVLRILRHFPEGTMVDMPLVTEGLIVRRKDGKTVGRPFQDFSIEEVLEKQDARVYGWKNLTVDDFERLGDAVNAIHLSMSSRTSCKMRLYLTTPPAYGLNMSSVRPKGFSFREPRPDSAGEQPTSGKRGVRRVGMEAFNSTSIGVTSGR